MSKNVKKRRKRCPSFHFLHFEIANEHFHCKTITHVMLYVQHYITRKLCYSKDDRAMRAI